MTCRQAGFGRSRILRRDHRLRRGMFLKARAFAVATARVALGAAGTLPGRMSRVCVICGKKPATGNNRSHSMVATKRRFNPNLQRVRLVLDGKPSREYVCTRCLKAGKVVKAI